MTTRTPLTTRIALVATIVVASLALATTSIGHTKVASTSPPSGSRVKAPKSASFTVNGAIKSGKLTVTGPKGKVASNGSGARDPRNVRRVLVSLKTGLAAGKYTASGSWVAADGHRQTTSFSFTITK